MAETLIGTPDPNGDATLERLIAQIVADLPPAQPLTHQQQVIADRLTVEVLDPALVVKRMKRGVQ